MATKRANTSQKPVPAPPAPTSTSNLHTASLGIGMLILTNYQAEVKQVLGLLLKALT